MGSPFLLAAFSDLGHGLGHRRLFVVGLLVFFQQFSPNNLNLWRRFDCHLYLVAVDLLDRDGDVLGDLYRFAFAAG